jgi:hypothetical protein
MCASPSYHKENEAEQGTKTIGPHSTPRQVNNEHSILINNKCSHFKLLTPFHVRGKVNAKLSDKLESHVNSEDGAKRQNGTLREPVVAANRWSVAVEHSGAFRLNP